MKLRLRRSDETVTGFGERLQVAERLLRLGARASVVSEVLAASGVMRPLIRRLYAGLRSSGRPRGPLPFDLPELLFTPLARLHASVFLHSWQRLRAAGASEAAALAGAWDHLAAACSRVRELPRSLSIDQAWVLARACDSGAVVRACCPACNRSYYDVLLRRTAQSSTNCDAPRGLRPTPVAQTRCPHCHCPARLDTLEGRQALVRAEAARRTVAALDAAPAQPLSELACRYARAEALFRAGARPPLVTQLTGLAMNELLRQLFVEVVGHGPRQGALPQLGPHVLATYEQRLQASVVVVTASRLRRAGCVPAEVLLATWVAYGSLFAASARFDINAVALIMRAGNHPDFRLLVCRRCGTRHLELKLDLPGRRCPICRAIERSRRESA